MAMTSSKDRDGFSMVGEEVAIGNRFLIIPLSTWVVIN